MRPLSETKKSEIYSEEDFYCIESTPYTYNLLNACETYLSTNKYRLTSKHDDLARKILNFYKTPLMAHGIMQEAVSQHILYALCEVLLGKSDTFLALINQVFNYQQEKPKFTNTIPLINHIKIELSSINKIFTLDTNALVFFIVANYPKKALKVWPAVNSKLSFNTTVRDCLATHAISLQDWEYLVQLQHHGNFTEVELASVFFEALTIHNFDVRIFKDIFEIIKNHKLVAFFLNEMDVGNSVSKLPDTEDHSAFFHALAEAKIHLDLFESEELLARQFYKHLSAFALTMADLKLMTQILDNVKSFLSGNLLAIFIDDKTKTLDKLLEKQQLPANKIALCNGIYELFYKKLEEVLMELPKYSPTRNFIKCSLLEIAISTDNLDCMKKWLSEWHIVISSDMSNTHLLTRCVNISRPDFFQHIFFHMKKECENEIENFLGIVANVLSHMNNVKDACNPAIVGIIMNHPKVAFQKCPVNKYVIKLGDQEDAFIPSSEMIKALDAVRLEKSWNMYRLFAQNSHMPKELTSIVGQFIYNECIEDNSTAKVSISQ